MREAVLHDHKKGLFQGSKRRSNLYHIIYAVCNLLLFLANIFSFVFSIIVGIAGKHIKHSRFLCDLDCKAVRIFAYSSTPEQSNKRSGTRLKTESACFARVRLLRHALPISLLILRKKPTVLQSICDLMFAFIPKTTRVHFFLNNEHC